MIEERDLQRRVRAAENWIFPSTLKPCILRCRWIDGKPHASLFYVNSGRRETCTISFTERMCGDVVDLYMMCDYAKAKDGGRPYLLVYDVLQMLSVNLEPTRYGIRYELARLLLEDASYYRKDATDDVRLRVPPLFHVSEIMGVMDYVIPSFYANVSGVRWFKDAPWPFEKAVSEKENSKETASSNPEFFPFIVDMPVEQDGGDHGKDAAPSDSGLSGTRIEQKQATKDTG